MPLVTDTQVKAIIDTNRDTTPFIVTADLIISEDFASSTLSAARLTQIELYLAAHFVALTEERGALTKHTVGDSSEEYGINTGDGFNLTRYGQQALNLDTSGTLKTLSDRKFTAEFRVV